MYVSGGTNAMWQHSGSVVPICKYQGMYAFNTQIFEQKSNFQASEALHMGGRFENILKLMKSCLSK